MNSSKELLSLAAWLEDPNNEILVAADSDDQELSVVAEALCQVSQILKTAADKLNLQVKESSFDEDNILDIAALASVLDKSDDPVLQKQASVLDQILLTLAAPKNATSAFKEASDKKTEELKNKYQEYKTKFNTKEAIEDATKAIEKSPFTQKRNNDHTKVPLSSRYCPDHPGSPVMHLGESEWQCVLDNKIYNYNSGFTTEKGVKVPGGSVSDQQPSADSIDVPFSDRAKRMGQEY